MLAMPQILMKFSGIFEGLYMKLWVFFIETTTWKVLLMLSKCS